MSNTTRRSRLDHILLSDGLDRFLNVAMPVAAAAAMFVWGALFARDFGWLWSR